MFFDTQRSFPIGVVRTSASLLDHAVILILTQARRELSRSIFVGDDVAIHFWYDTLSSCGNIVAYYWNPKREGFVRNERLAFIPMARKGEAARRTNIIIDLIRCHPSGYCGVGADLTNKVSFDAVTDKNNRKIYFCCRPGEI
ncbi:hypothetical protein P775_02685 [Puniceibacterium antarcticum]|uniref:Uncharacterized protein n=1 Tax=Puniceibacterium antarcticum TaxID=1206336 RepID=A0A2G8RJU2_9RHOB|nr:hypothetical protein P775_02685 [Puniceibacterium antarcticum]